MSDMSGHPTIVCFVGSWTYKSIFFLIIIKKTTVFFLHPSCKANSHCSHMDLLPLSRKTSRLLSQAGRGGCVGQPPREEQMGFIYSLLQDLYAGNCLLKPAQKPTGF